MKTIDDYKKEFLALAKEMCKDLGAESVRSIYVCDVNHKYEKCTIEF